MNDPYDVTFAAGDPTPGRRKNIWDASRPPNLSDDASRGLSIGSVWVDVHARMVYLCASAAADAAIWAALTDGQGVDTGQVVAANRALALLTEHEHRTNAHGAVAGSGTPSSTVVSETSAGQSPAAGSATDYSRGDHTHGTPASGAIDWGETGDIDSITFGQSVDAGVLDEAARADHSHGMATILDADLPSTVARDTEVASAITNALAQAGQRSLALLTEHSSRAAHPGYSASGHGHTHSALTGITAIDHHPAAAAGPDANDTIDATGAVGTADTFARSGHGHQLVTTAGPGANDTIDAAGAAGATGAVARAGHGHRVDTTAGPGGDITVGAAGAAGATGAIARASHGHRVDPDAGGGANDTIDVAGTTGSATALARGGHGHRLDTYSSAASTLGTAAAGTSGQAPSRGDHVHAHGTGTVANAHSHADLSGVTVDQHHTENHQSRHNNAGADALKLDDLATPDDNADLDASTARHGLLRKLPGGTTTFLRADGTFATPPGGSGVHDHPEVAARANGRSLALLTEHARRPDGHRHDLNSHPGNDHLELRDDGASPVLRLRKSSGAGARGAIIWEEWEPGDGFWWGSSFISAAAGSIVIGHDGILAGQRGWTVDGFGSLIPFDTAAMPGPSLGSDTELVKEVHARDLYVYGRYEQRGGPIFRARESETGWESLETPVGLLTVASTTTHVGLWEAG